MVNGAGLQWRPGHHQTGGRRAGNFLDVGGGANKEQIRNAFKILMSDKKSAPCSSISWWHSPLRHPRPGVVDAVQELGSAPIVIRMEGTNVEEGSGSCAKAR